MAKPSNKQISALLSLILATLLWGTSFAAQTDSTKYIGPLTFVVARSIVGAMALGSVLALKKLINSKRKKNAVTGITEPEVTDNKPTVKLSKRLIAGVACGIAISFASALQQAGIYYNSVVMQTDATGKAGFLTALYIIFVPILGVFFKRKLSANIICGSVLAVIGMYLLCVSGSSDVSLGDIMLILCGFMYAVHIIVIDIMGKNIDPIELSFYQFLTAALVLVIPAIITEGNQPLDLGGGLFSIIYLGIFSSAVAFTAQIYSQKQLHPAVASIVMCFESVVAAISGAIFLAESMTAKQIGACILLFMGILVAEFGSYIVDSLKKRFCRSDDKLKPTK